MNKENSHQPWDIRKLTTIILKVLQKWLSYSWILWETWWNTKAKVIFGNSFYFLSSKTCFWEYKKKNLYFWNKKYVWLAEIKKIIVINNCLAKFATCLIVLLKITFTSS